MHQSGKTTKGELGYKVIRNKREALGRERFQKKMNTFFEYFCTLKKMYILF